jgi:aspartyl-tRNA(Asn)/glutamyl-tRNA(Gln) amidotransferase subunit A
MLGTYTLSHGYYDAYYKKAEKARILIVQDFKRALESVDVIVGPTTPTTATKIGDMDKYPFFGELMDQMNEPAAAAGIPAINVPAGMHEGLPVGMQIMGNHFDEETILQLAHKYEKETNFYQVRETILNKYPEL